MIRVLIVDDDKLVRRGLASAMPWKNFGMEVVGEANNGENALKFMEEHRIDLLITDLSMPVMSGIELMRIVREKYPLVQIVVLTLHQDFEYVQEALRLGAIDYIAKIQLEQEQFEAVLGRIVLLMGKKDGRRGAGRPEGWEKFNEQYTELFYGQDSSPSNSVISNIFIERITDRWSAADWIFDDARFTANLQELRASHIPPVRLARIFFALSAEWNRLYQPILGSPIQIEDFFPSWHEFEGWLIELRERIKLANTKPLLSKEIQSSIVKAIHLAQQQLSEPISAAEIAQRVNMSSSYFSQCFKQYTGVTFTDYVRDLRMQRAKEFLKNTTRTIQWIAEQIGYNDEKYFSRLFREQVGVLPSEFRHNHSERGS